jgi:ABC-2 type transport system ATP-binding protein
MIEIKNLTKRFGEKAALDGLSFSVRDGVAFGFLGRNGAGKTTTIRILMNIFREDSGEALIGGVPAYKSKIRIGYLPEERGLYSKRPVLEQMIYFGKLKEIPSAEAERFAREKLEELGATEYTDKKLETLSKGNQQKIQLAIALIGDPDVVILDEPFSGLDPINAQILKDAVRRQVQLGKTVIFSSHQMNQVEEFCDDICIIEAGKSVIEGDLAEIKRSYPRDRIYISVSADGSGGRAASAMPAASAASAMQYAKKLIEALPFVRHTADYEQGIAVTLTDPGQRRSLYQALGDNGITPDSFSVIEPTLEQIFVEKAGGAR